MLAPNHSRQPDRAQPDIRTCSRSEQIFADIATGTLDRGKVAIGRKDDRVIIAVGKETDFHVMIIWLAGQELYHERWSTSRDPRTAAPSSGVMIQGAKFKYDAATGSVEIFDTSYTFGGFRDGLLSEPTEKVVKRYLEKKIREHRESVALDHASISRTPDARV